MLSAKAHMEPFTWTMAVGRPAKRRVKSGWLSALAALNRCMLWLLMAKTPLLVELSLVIGCTRVVVGSIFLC